MEATMTFPEYFQTINISHAFQPIIDIDEKRIVSYEVLIRGGDGEPPYMVFDKVDKCDFNLFDQYSREKAIELAQKLGINTDLNFNFTPSAVTFNGGEFIERTLIKAEQYGFDHRKLIIEVTENEEIYNKNYFASILNIIKQDGVNIAIDDFGSGYAGLNMLINVKPEVLKLDIDLIRDIHKDGAKQSVVRAVCEVCLELGIDVLAEGVEKKEEFEFLRNIDISLYQGYFFAKPGFASLPKVDFSDL
jgi:EAL domain-containing protein (putative c-di-GMP-specific phosphodiesterase class I)